MTRNEFATIKVLLQESGADLNTEEFPNIRDRLLDGANIIDLYNELYRYINFRIAEESMEPVESHKFTAQMESDFWEQAQEILVDKPMRQLSNAPLANLANDPQRYYMEQLLKIYTTETDDLDDMKNLATAADIFQEYLAKTEIPRWEKHCEEELLKLNTINKAADAIVTALTTLSVPGAEQESEKGIRAMIDAAVDKKIRNLAK